MKYLNKKTMLATVLLTVLMIFFYTPMTVRADQDAVKIPYKKNVTLSNSSNLYEVTFTKAQLAGRKLSSVTCSNTAVATEGYVAYKKTSFSFEPISTGTVTYTVTLSAKGKSTIKKEITVQLIEFENPFTSVIFGSSNIVKNLGRGGWAYRTTKKKSEKISVKVKKGWQLVSISDVYSGTKIKNNTVFKYPSRFVSLYIKVKNKSTGFTETVLVSIDAQNVKVQ